MLTPEELAPGPADLELGVRLVAEGWRSVSTKSRAIARWTPGFEPPTGLEMVRPALHDTVHGKAAIEMWERHGRTTSRLRDAFQDQTGTLERRELTVRQWQGFKKAGGKTA